MQAESGGRPDTLNNNPATGDYSVGCFQINILGSLAKNRPTEAELKDPEVNVKFAYNMWKNQGWTPWSVCKNGKVQCINS